MNVEPILCKLRFLFDSTKQKCKILFGKWVVSPTFVKFFTHMDMHIILYIYAKTGYKTHQGVASKRNRRQRARKNDLILTQKHTLKNANDDLQQNYDDLYENYDHHSTLKTASPLLTENGQKLGLRRLFCQIS